MPEEHEHSADQMYYVGWLVQHNRLWLLVMALVLVNTLQAVMGIAQLLRYRPSIQYVTLTGGYPVLWNEHNELVIGGSVYQPERLRAVVLDFIQDRYAYDWQDIQKINTAFRYLSADAQKAEQAKLATEAVIGNHIKISVRPDLSHFAVKPQGPGRFSVEIPAQVSMTDAVRYTDAEHPYIKTVTIQLVVQTTAPTDLNPLGYTIVSTGKDIL